MKLNANKYWRTSPSYLEHLNEKEIIHGSQEFEKSNRKKNVALVEFINHVHEVNLQIEENCAW